MKVIDWERRRTRSRRASIPDRPEQSADEVFEKKRREERERDRKRRERIGQ